MGNNYYDITVGRDATVSSNPASPYNSGSGRDNDYLNWVGWYGSPTLYPYRWVVAAASDPEGTKSSNYWIEARIYFQFYQIYKNPGDAHLLYVAPFESYLPFSETSAGWSWVDGSIKQMASRPIGESGMWRYFRIPYAFWDEWKEYSETSWAIVLREYQQYPNLALEIYTSEDTGGRKPFFRVFYANRPDSLSMTYPDNSIAQVKATWSSSPCSTDSFIAGYTIKRGSTTVSTPGSGTTQVYLSQDNGTNYTYYIYGRYTSGEVTNFLSPNWRSSSVSVAVVPQNFNVSPLSDQANVTWNAVPNSGNCDYYEIAYKLHSGESWSNTTSTSTSKLIDLDPGEWDFKMRAHYNASYTGYSDYTSTSTKTIEHFDGWVKNIQLDNQLFPASGGEDTPAATSYTPTLHFEIDDPEEYGLLIAEYEITDDATTPNVLYSADGLSTTTVNKVMGEPHSPWWGPGEEQTLGLILTVIDNYANEYVIPDLNFYGHNVAPDAPTLVSPGDETIHDTDYTVDFSWTFNDDDTSSGDSQSAAYLEVSKGTEQNIVNTNLGITGDPNVGSDEFYNNIDFDVSGCGEGVYFWRVKTYDQAGEVSSFSGYNSFTIYINEDPTAPTLSSPGSSADLFNLSSATFTWTHNDADPSDLDPQQASEWHLYSDDGVTDYGPSPVSITSAPLNQYILDTSCLQGSYNAPATYYWTARTQDSQDEWGPFAAKRSFQWYGMNSNPLSPLLLTPGSGQTYWLDPEEGYEATFTWGFRDPNEGAPANDYQTVANLKIKNEAHDLVDTVQVTTAQTGKYTFTDVGVYYWCVECKDAYGAWGSSSADRLIVITNETLPPTPTSPTGLSSVRLGTPLKWAYNNRYTGDFQSGYHARVYNNSGTIIWERDTGGGSTYSNAEEIYLPKGLLSKGASYSWDLAVYGAPYDEAEKSPFTSRQYFVVTNDTTYLITVSDLVHVNEASPTTNYASDACSLVKESGTDNYDLLLNVSQVELEALESSNILSDPGYVKLVLFAERANDTSYVMDVKKNTSSWSRGSVTWNTKPSTASLSNTYGVDSIDVAEESGGTYLYLNSLIAIDGDGLVATLSAWADGGTNYGLTITTSGTTDGELRLDQDPPTIDGEDMDHYLVLHVDVPPSVVLTQPNGTEESPTSIPGNNGFYQFQWGTTTGAGDYQNGVTIHVQKKVGESWVNDTTVRGEGEFFSATQQEYFYLSHLNEEGTFQFPESNNYRWRVKADNQHGTSGEYSSYGYFYTTGPAAPDAPTILSPTNGATVSSTTPLITWSFTDPDPGGYQSAFYIQVHDNDTDTAMYDPGWQYSSNPYFTIPKSANLAWYGDYRVRVMVMDNENIMSTWGTASSFLVSPGFWGQCDWDGGAGQGSWDDTDKFHSSSNVTYSGGRISLSLGQESGYLISSSKRRTDLSKTVVPRWDIDGTGTEIIKVYVRGGNVATPNSSWTEWLEVTSGESIPSAVKNKLYLQYKVEITSGG